MYCYKCIALAHTEHILWDYVSLNIKDTDFSSKFNLEVMTDNDLTMLSYASLY